MEHFSTGEEWQGEIHERAAARALRRSRLPEPFFCARYSFSPYQGCGHGCLYCDGRAERYYVEGDFSRDIAVRINLPELLAREIGLARERAPVAVGSGVSDAYQPAEKRMRLTRACAEVIESSGLPVILATKSSLVERDLDIWSRVNRQAGFVLLMSINTTDELLRSRMEPGASSISDRFQTLRRFKDAGCGTGILAMPLLPFLSDAPASIERLVERAVDVGVGTLMSGLLTLRPGRQKDFYLERLAARTAPVARSAVDPVASDPSAEPTHPTPEVLLRRYAELYQENRPSGAPIASYSRRLSALCSELCERYGVDAQIPHRLFKGRMGPADEAYLLLRLMEPLYRRRGVDVRPLVAGTGRYAAWLDQERRTFNRRRSLPATWVDDRFRELAADGGTRLADLLQNAKLAHFVRRATGEGSCFNALNLALEPCPGGAARGTP